MNYTENFHLPQWDETDRIMRTDFNRMCANMEEGLTRGREEWEQLRTGTWDRLCRLAYNHYRAVENMDPFPYQEGVFHQNPAKNPAGVTGTGLWDGVCFTAKNETALTPEVLEAGFRRITPLSMVKGNLAACQSMTGNLRVPASGLLRRFNLIGNFYENVPDTPARFQISLTNQETGVVEQAMEVDLSLNVASGSFSYRPADIALHVLGGVDYLVTLQPLEAVYSANNGWINFDPHGLADTYGGTGAVAATHTLRELAGGERGAVILHCLITGAGGTLRFTWDGAERQPDAQRMVKARDGRMVRELIYYRDEIIPEDSRISLQFTCATGGSFLFYDWGATLL